MRYARLLCLLLALGGCREQASDQLHEHVELLQSDMERLAFEYNRTLDMLIACEKQTSSAREIEQAYRALADTREEFTLEDEDVVDPSDITRGPIGHSSYEAFEQWRDRLETILNQPVSSSEEKLLIEDPRFSEELKSFFLGQLRVQEEIRDELRSLKALLQERLPEPPWRHPADGTFEEKAP